MVNTLEKEYKCAYKEVCVIIEHLEDDIRNKIPEDKINFYKKHMDNEHEFEIDNEKELEDQNILYQTRCILANLFIDYIATKEDKDKILKEEQEEIKQIEQAKKNKYNPDDIFKNKPENIVEKQKIEVSQIKVEEISTDMIVKDENESYFEKIKNNIISFIKKYLKK